MVDTAPYVQSEHFYYCIYSPSLIIPKVPRAQENRDYQNARKYAEHFHIIFESTPNQSGNVTDREFVAFFNVLRCFEEGLETH